MANESERPAAIPLAVSAETPVVYSNTARIVHGRYDFAIQFGLTRIVSGAIDQPPEITRSTEAIVYLSPQHAKAFLLALQDNIGKFEAEFGKIDTSDHADRPGK